MEKASIAIAIGSGFHETKFLICLFSKVAKRSIFGHPNLLAIEVNMSGFSIHSVLSLNFREAVSASVFSMPGIKADVSHIDLFSHHSHMVLDS